MDFSRVPKYKVIQKEFFLPDAGKYVGFGLEALSPNTGERLHVIYDISPAFEFVSFLAEQFNHLELELVHFSDVVEDALV